MELEDGDGIRVIQILRVAIGGRFPRVSFALYMVGNLGIAWPIAIGPGFAKLVGGSVMKSGEGVAWPRVYSSHGRE